MPSYELEGQIDTIFSTKTFDSGFCVREFIVETVDEKYPQMVKLQVVKDKCDALDEYNEGDKVDVKFNLRGNKIAEGKWEGNVFNKNECWDMKKKEVSRDVLDAAERAQAIMDDEQKDEIPMGDDSGSSDLPF